MAHVINWSTLDYRNNVTTFCFMIVALTTSLTLFLSFTGTQLLPAERTRYAFRFNANVRPSKATTMQNDFQNHQPGNEFPRQLLQPPLIQQTTEPAESLDPVCHKWACDCEQMYERYSFAPGFWGGVVEIANTTARTQTQTWYAESCKGIPYNPAWWRQSMLVVRQERECLLGLNDDRPSYAHQVHPQWRVCGAADTSPSAVLHARRFREWQALDVSRTTSKVSVLPFDSPFWTANERALLKCTAAVDDKKTVDNRNKRQQCRDDLVRCEGNESCALLEHAHGPYWSCASTQTAENMATMVDEREIHVDVGLSRVISLQLPNVKATSTPPPPQPPPTLLVCDPKFQNEVVAFVGDSVVEQTFYSFVTGLHRHTDGVGHLNVTVVDAIPPPYTDVYRPPESVPGRTKCYGPLTPRLWTFTLTIPTTTNNNNSNNDTNNNINNDDDNNNINTGRQPRQCTVQTLYHAVRKFCVDENITAFLQLNNVSIAVGQLSLHYRLDAKDHDVDDQCQNLAKKTAAFVKYFKNWQQLQQLQQHQQQQQQQQQPPPPQQQQQLPQQQQQQHTKRAVVVWLGVSGQHFANGGIYNGNTSLLQHCEAASAEGDPSTEMMAMYDKVAIETILQMGMCTGWACPSNVDRVNENENNDNDNNNTTTTNNNDDTQMSTMYFLPRFPSLRPAHTHHPGQRVGANGVKGWDCTHWCYSAGLYESLWRRLSAVANHSRSIDVSS